jgi:hypothetical protein
MRALPVLALVLATSLAHAGAGPRVNPKEAASRRGQLVTLVGKVTEVQRRDDGLVLMLGDAPGLAVVVPQRAVGSFSRDLSTLHEQTIEVDGFVTEPGQPLAIVLERPEQLAVPGGPQSPEALEKQVEILQDELARRRAADPPDLKSETYGLSRQGTPIQRYAMESQVLAEEGVPDRVEWGPRGRILYYNNGGKKYSFDENGQLIDVRTW